MSARHLVKMSAESFDAIPQKAVPRNVQEQDPWFESAQAIDFIIGAYCDKLVFKDEPVYEMLLNQDRRRVATKGQRMLFSLSVFDGEVKNGGLTQFFWNDLDLIDDVSDALKGLEITNLSELYENAVESFLAKQEDWNTLQEEHSAEPDWNPFQKSYEFFDLGWFDDAYYDGHDPHDFGKIVKAGMSSAMMKRLKDYVSTHPEEFIET